VTMIAEQVGRAFEGWWECDGRVADAVHAFYLSASSPGRMAQRQAFAERCRGFVERHEHEHRHEPLVHRHPHHPDLHHRHEH
jgi:hypothetical protein